MRYRELVAGLKKARKEAARHGMQCALIGGMAVSVWGTPRATNDVDFLVWHPDGASLDRFFRMMLETYPESEHFPTTEGLIAQCVRVTYPGGMHVDWIAPRYRWQVQMLERAFLIQVGGTAIAVIDPIDLIVMKLKAGGVKDDADAANLFATLEGRPELVQRLQATAHRLGVDRKVARLMRTKR